MTLVELVITIAIAAVIFTGMSGAVQAVIGSSTQNRNYGIALGLAKRQMAVMNNAAYPAVAAETALSADAAFPDFIPTQEVVSVATDGSESLREIRVRVRHGSSTGPVLVALYTYRTSIATFGDGT
jgi:hypothetical protein